MLVSFFVSWSSVSGYVFVHTHVFKQRRKYLVWRLISTRGFVSVVRVISVAVDNDMAVVLGRSAADMVNSSVPFVCSFNYKSNCHMRIPQDNVVLYKDYACCMF